MFTRESHSLIALSTSQCVRVQEKRRESERGEKRREERVREREKRVREREESERERRE